MFNSTHEFEALLHHYRRPENEAARLAIVRQARTLVLERHLWSHRASYFEDAAREALANFQSAASQPGVSPALRSASGRSGAASRGKAATAPASTERHRVGGKGRPDGGLPSAVAGEHAATNGTARRHHGSSSSVRSTRLEASDASHAPGKPTPPGSGAAQDAANGVREGQPAPLFLREERLEVLKKARAVGALMDEMYRKARQLLAGTGSSKGEGRGQTASHSAV